MPPINLLIKPVSDLCDMRCTYCFYRDVSDKRQVKSYGVMDDSTLEHLVEKTLRFADGYATFAFQGGEPMLAGLDFYKKLVTYQQKYARPGVVVYNTIQTNGLHINSQWAAFLSKHKFLLGVSLDGPAHLHDKYRLDGNSAGTHPRVMGALALLSRYKVEYNILAVVSADVAHNAAEVYSFFKANHFSYLQFIPCMDPLDEVSGKHPYSLGAKDYLLFLTTVFDLWHDDFMKGTGVSIRYFDNLVSMLMGETRLSCGMNGRCCIQFVVEADGGVYPCDFYVLDEWKIGTIWANSFQEMASSEQATAFIAQSVPVDAKCNACQWFSLCKGGCRRHRMTDGNGSATANYLCEAYQGFFAHAAEKLRSVAALCLKEST